MRAGQSTPSLTLVSGQSAHGRAELQSNGNGDAERDVQHFLVCRGLIFPLRPNCMFRSSSPELS